MTHASVDALVDHARTRLARLSPAQALAEVAQGAVIVDIRPSWQRRDDGEIPGSLIVERNHLEWRLHPDSDARLPQAVPGSRWVLVCTEGYASSLAAASLVSLGISATDVEGGIRAWRSAGLPVVEGPPTPVEQVVAS